MGLMSQLKLAWKSASRSESTVSNVQWASHSSTAPIEDVSVDHCRIEIFVPEQFLNCPDVVSGFQQMGGEAMTEMCGNWHV